MGNWKLWLHGLAAAVIGGGSSAVVSGVTLGAIDPSHFNFGHEFGRTMEVMGVLFIINGLMSAFAYLKQSPLPQ